MKMNIFNYSKIMEIGDMCIKTNVGYTTILKNVQHISDLCLNVLFTLAMD